MARLGGLWRDGQASLLAHSAPTSFLTAPVSEPTACLALSNIPPLSSASGVHCDAPSVFLAATEAARGLVATGLAVAGLGATGFAAAAGWAESAGLAAVAAGSPSAAAGLTLARLACAAVRFFAGFAAAGVSPGAFASAGAEDAGSDCSPLLIMAEIASGDGAATVAGDVTTVACGVVSGASDPSGRIVATYVSLVAEAGAETAGAVLACVAWLVGAAWLVAGLAGRRGGGRSIGRDRADIHLLFSGWRAAIRKRQRHGAREADEHKRRERENQAPRLKCLHRQAGRLRGPPRIARGGFSDRLATRRWGQIVPRLRQLTVDTPVTGANPAQMLFELLNARTKLLLIKQLSHALTLR